MHQTSRTPHRERGKSSPRMKTSSELLPEGEAESERTGDTLFSPRSNTTYSHILKPLLSGCLTGQIQALFAYCTGLIRAEIELSGDPNLKKRLHDFKLANKRRLRIGLLCGTTYTTASLGVFEILTNKLRTINDGRTLPLYQEACCGLASGATAAFVYQPFMLAQFHTAAHDLTYRNLFSTLCHIVRDEGALALWRGSGPYICTQMAAKMGMLASYNRSLNYLMDCKGLSKSHAQIGAGIISGFFAAACSQSVMYIKVVKDNLQNQYHAGEKHAYRNIPLYITQILTPQRGFKFLNYFRHWAAFCVVQLWIYEDIHTILESMDSRKDEISF